MSGNFQNKPPERRSSIKYYFYTKIKEIESGWSPIKNHRVFLVFWLTSIVSSLGLSMHDASASWLMTIQTQSPFLVSLIPAVSSLSIAIFILVGGALSDIFNRKLLFLVVQSWMMIVSGVMGIVTLMDTMTPSLLLIFTFTLGIGLALNMPLVIIISIEMTSLQERQATLTLSSITVNIGRAAGPMLGGIIIASFGGPGVVFLINALTFALMFYVVYKWKRTNTKSDLPPEHVIEAIRTGIRYVIHSRQSQSMFVRASSFIIFGSVIFAILPVLVREDLGLGSVSFGILLGLLGVGAIIGGTIILPLIRRKISYESIVIGSTILLASVLVILGFVRDFNILSIAMLLGGIGWILIISTLHFSMSISVPKWVGPRGLAFYLLLFQTSTTIGSIVWGLVTSYLGIHYAFLLAAIGMIMGLITGLKYKLTADLDIENEPSKHWPSPQVILEPSRESLHVLIEIEYNINPPNLQEFITAIKELSVIRKRDGALRWGLYRDIGDPSVFIETFFVNSWIEHLRQHERITIEDKKIQDKVNSFNKEGNPPMVSHLIAVDLSKRKNRVAK